MHSTYITLTSLEHFRSMEFMNPGTRLVLKKEVNAYDDEAIAVYSERGTKYGYVANSCHTVARGTHSAGYIYRDFEDQAACVVRFRKDDMAIAELETGTEDSEETEEVANDEGDA